LRLIASKGRHSLVINVRHLPLSGRSIAAGCGNVLIREAASQGTIVVIS